MSEPVLVVAAVRQELSDFSSCSSQNVQTLITGMGPQRARERVRKWLARRSCRCLVSAGFAGATQPGLRTGDLVIADEVLEAASGWIHVPVRAMAQRVPGPVQVGRLVTSPRLVLTPAAKAEMGRRLKGLAVDMETSVVAQLASEAEIPWVSVRVVLDPMEQFLFSPRTLLLGVRQASQRLGAYLSRVVEAI